MLIYTFLHRFAIEQSPKLLASAGSVYSPAELFLPWGERVLFFSLSFFSFSFFSFPSLSLNAAKNSTS